jgi:hypothetical protein
MSEIALQKLPHQTLEFSASRRHNSRVQKKSKLLFLPLLFASVCAAQSNIKPEWAVFSSKLKWESPPPELHSNTKSARARILVFFPSGGYGEVYCYLIRQETEAYQSPEGTGRLWEQALGTKRVAE